MSALRHGLFSAAFMHCDRCVSNASCERFKPGGVCVLEQETFEKIVSEFVEEYDLDDVADKILLERAAMYLIRIIRAEAYEAFVGLSEQTVYWDTYISRMDSALRGLFNDLAVSRAKRIGLQKGEGMLADLDDFMRKFTKEKVKSEASSKGEIKQRVLKRSLPVRAELWLMWEKEYPELREILMRRRKVDEEKTEGSAS
jgi:hypothetical protein